MATTTSWTINTQLPRRITVAREMRGFSQAELTKKLGFNDRQTLAAIEAGQRRVTPEELVALADATGQDLDFFTDPFRLVGEGAFSYRASGTETKALDKFEQQAGRWLALWRQLGQYRGELPGPLRPRLAINQHSTFEDAQLAGEAVARELELGDAPAQTLASALEKKFKLLVLEVDMPRGVSGVAVQLATGDAIFINRAESPQRKAFDLAHELFHVLTWDALPPGRVDRENPTAYNQKRIEQLADNFAAALLMPQHLLKPRWQKLLPTSPLPDSLAILAEHFRVSTPAVGWRLVALGWLKKADLPNSPPRKAPGKPKLAPHPQFSHPFVERMAWGLERGELSVQRLLELLDLDLDEFRACCKAHGVKVDIGL